jgi:D-3-phosphoglycerate dehydrogenase
MAQWRVLIGSRSFGTAAPEHITELKQAGCEVIPNGVGRAYRAEELLTVLRDVDAIITGTDELTGEVIASANRLKTIAKHGVGVDNIDLDAARARGIVVTATPGTMHDSVADLAMALLLAVARRIVPMDEGVKAGGWPRSTGMELRGKTMGLVGFGRIGREVARRAQGFGMRIVAFDPYPDETYAARHNVTLLPFEELLKSSDVVSLHAAASDSGPLLGERELAMMREGAIVINSARGQLIDETALAEAIRAGRLGGAGLDVFTHEPPQDSPLLLLDRVVLTPHLGGQTQEALCAMGAMCVENCLLALRGEKPLHEV